jgi:hypothetical protein
VVLVWRKPQRPGEPELPDVSVVGSGFAVGSAALGVGLLRASWLRRGGGQPWLTAAGWAAFVCGAGFWHRAGLGWDEGIALAMLAPSLMAFLVLMRQAQWRPTAVGSRTGRRSQGRVQQAAEPAAAGQTAAGQTRGPTAPRGAVCVGVGSESGGSLGRGVARTVLAGPVALVAALGITGWVALRAPGMAANRVVAAGFVLPVGLWERSGRPWIVS